MKYKVGDRVRIKSLDWYNENKDKDGVVHCGDTVFDNYMSVFCGSVVTISWVYPYNRYDIREDMHYRDWTDEMIECKVEDETVHNKWTGLKVELDLSKTVIGVSNVESLRGERFMSGFVKAIIPPEGYQFVDENGNVINATKIVLEKKKKEYPKTYEECCRVMGINPHNELCVESTEDYADDYENKLFDKVNTLYKLIICRDAYWKLYGEEIGLGKPWEPSDSDYITGRYCIFVHRGNILCDTPAQDCIFTFPTEEMRDAFKENFDPDIEFCKELL